MSNCSLCGDPMPAGEEMFKYHGHSGPCPKPPKPKDPPPEPILQFFDFTHLPPHLQDVSRPFAQIALDHIMTLPRNPERTVALRKLLEAKDAAVRAILAKPPT